jgi:ABC-2 type transport system permease protein
MNTQATALPESPLEMEPRKPATLSATRPLYWSIRRELWENRSIYLAPLAAAAIFFFGFSISRITLPHRMRAISALDAAQQRAAIAMPYNVAAVLIILTTLIVAVFYCLDTLHGERRDRSILFWKSLPVSDLTTVLSKASIPLVVLPLVAFAIIVPLQLTMLLLSTAVLLVTGSSAASLWTQFRLFPESMILLYGLTVHALWYAPFYGWLMLVSAWARRTPFLWAVLPPLALGVFERIAFQTTYFGSLMKHRASGAMAKAFVLEPGNKGDITRLSQLDPLGFLGSPGLWLGLIAAALFLAVAVRLRRRGEPL